MASEKSPNTNNGNSPDKRFQSMGQVHTHVVDTFDSEISEQQRQSISTRYVVEKEIGKGGMGRVLLAIDTKIGNRRVAIKQMLSAHVGNRELFARFIVEMHNAGTLNHKNIVHVYDSDTAAEFPYLVSEYIDGGSLASRCDGKMPLGQVLDIGKQMCEAMIAAHAAGILHRDIKPSNILLNHDHVVKLTDFGLSKSASNYDISLTGRSLGTPFYMSPEQIGNSKAVDCRSDIYSLGVTLYHLATGVHPQTIRLEILDEPLASLIGRALEMNPDNRFSDASRMHREFINAIRSSLPAEEHISAGSVQIQVPTPKPGQCVQCGTMNVESRKFCRQCAAKLSAKCLKCAETLPVWEAVCDACGAIQAELLKTTRKTIEAERAKAILLLEGKDFDGARQCISILHGYGEDPRTSKEIVWLPELSKEVDIKEHATNSMIEEHLKKMSNLIENSEPDTARSLLQELLSLPSSIQDRIVSGTRIPLRQHLRTLTKKIEKLTKRTAKVRDQKTQKTESCGESKATQIPSETTVNKTLVRRHTIRLFTTFLMAFVPLFLSTWFTCDFAAKSMGLFFLTCFLQIPFLVLFLSWMYRYVNTKHYWPILSLSITAIWTISFANPYFYTISFYKDITGSWIPALYTEALAMNSIIYSLSIISSQLFKQYGTTRHLAGFIIHPANRSMTAGMNRTQIQSLYTLLFFLILPWLVSLILFQEPKEFFYNITNYSRDAWGIVPDSIFIVPVLFFIFNFAFRFIVLNLLDHNRRFRMRVLKAFLICCITVLTASILNYNFRIRYGFSTRYDLASRFPDKSEFLSCLLLVFGGTMVLFFANLYLEWWYYLGDQRILSAAESNFDRGSFEDQSESQTIESSSK